MYSCASAFLPQVWCSCGGWVASQTPRVSTEGAAKVTAFSYFFFQDAAENSKHCFFRGFRGTGDLNNNAFSTKNVLLNQKKIYFPKEYKKL